MIATAARRGGVRGGGPPSKSGRNIKEGSPCQHDALLRPSRALPADDSRPTARESRVEEDLLVSPYCSATFFVGVATTARQVLTMPADASLDAQGLQPTGATRARSRAFLAAAEEAAAPGAAPAPRLSRRAVLAATEPSVLTPSQACCDALIAATRQPLADAQPRASHQPPAMGYNPPSHQTPGLAVAGLLVGLVGCRAGHAWAGRPGAAAGGIP